jgi:6-phosphofructokinase
MSTMKIAILTSGGDSAGMNALVRTVVKAGILKCDASTHLSASNFHLFPYS